MNQLAVCGGFQKGAETPVFHFRDIKDYGVTFESVVAEVEAAAEDKNVQENTRKAEGIHIQDVAWGRVIQKGKVSSIHETPLSKQDGKKVVQIGNETFLCAFIEAPSAVELFEKERNLDRRNVEQRTFSTGGKVFDFTV